MIDFIKSLLQTVQPPLSSAWLAAVCCLFLAACATVTPPTLPTLPPSIPPPPSLAGWVPLVDAARQFQACAADWRVSSTGATLKTPHHTIGFFTNSRRLEIDGVCAWLNAPLTAHPAGSDCFYLSPPDVRDLVALHTPPETRLPQTAHRRFLTVMLDPGHGGDDTGAVGAGTRRQEKELVLDLARRTAAALATAPVQVLFSRSDDLTLPLDLRVTHAANAPADCLVSIHANAAANVQAAGIETYLVPAADWASTGGGAAEAAVPGNRFDGANFALAYAVHSRLAGLDRPDRGIKRARYHILRNAPCPAILVEVGFLSNPDEASQLDTDAHRQRLAEAIAAGIRAYAD